MKKFNKNNFSASFKTRAFRVGSYSVAATVVFIAIVVIVNLLAGALPDRWVEFDTSDQQLYTLSQQTNEMVGSLEKEVTVYWLVRSGYEDPSIENLLGRYTDLSGNFKVVKKDPDLYPTFANTYVETFNENGLIVTCGDRFRYVDYYDIFTIDEYAYYYQGKQIWTFSGEIALTGAVDFVISEDLPKLYLLSGHGEEAIPESFATALEHENIETASLTLLADAAVPEDADGVLIFAPKSDLSADEKAILEQYLAQGGKMLMFTDLLPEGSRLTNLESIAAPYGVTPVEGMVMEGTQGNYAMDRPFCLLPELSNHSITAPLKEGGYRVVLFPAYGLQVETDTPEGVYVSKLLTTTKSSYSKVDGMAITTYEKEENDIDGPFALSVSVADTNTGAGLIWTTSSKLLNDNNNALVSGGNLDLFLNMVNYLCEEEDAGLSIRAKNLTSDLLTLDSGTIATFSLLLIVVLPLGYLAAGIVVWYRRKRK